MKWNARIGSHENTANFTQRLRHQHYTHLPSLGIHPHRRHLQRRRLRHVVWYRALHRNPKYLRTSYAPPIRLRFWPPLQVNLYSVELSPRKLFTQRHSPKCCRRAATVFLTSYQRHSTTKFLALRSSGVFIDAGQEQINGHGRREERRAFGDANVPE